MVAQSVARAAREAPELFQQVLNLRLPQAWRSLMSVRRTTTPFPMYPVAFESIDAKARYDWKLMIAEHFLRGNQQSISKEVAIMIPLGGRDFAQLSCEAAGIDPNALLSDPTVPIRLRVVFGDDTLYSHVYAIADLRRIARERSKRRPLFPWNRTWEHILWPAIVKELPDAA